jgi:DNA-binding MurR/RpiR family transcriptional regulator
MVNKESLEREVTKETIENVFKETKEFLEKTKNLNNNKKTEKIK